MVIIHAFLEILIFKFSIYYSILVQGPPSAARTRNILSGSRTLRYTKSNRKTISQFITSLVYFNHLLEVGTPFGTLLGISPWNPSLKPQHYKQCGKLATADLLLSTQNQTEILGEFSCINSMLFLTTCLVRKVMKP